MVTLRSVEIESVLSSHARVIWVSLSAGSSASPGSSTCTLDTWTVRPSSPSVAWIDSTPSAAESFRQSMTGAGLRFGTTLAAMARASSRAARSQTIFMVFLAGSVDR